MHHVLRGPYFVGKTACNLDIIFTEAHTLPGSFELLVDLPAVLLTWCLGGGARCAGGAGLVI